MRPPGRCLFAAATCSAIIAIVSVVLLLVSEGGGGADARVKETSPARNRDPKSSAVDPPAQKGKRLEIEETRERGDTKSGPKESALPKPAGNDALDVEQRSVKTERSGALNEEELSNALRSLSSDPDPTVRVDAIQEVQRHFRHRPKDSYLLGYVVGAALNDGFLVVRRVAAQFLYFHPSPSAFDTYVRVLTTDRSVEVRQWLLKDLSTSSVLPDDPLYLKSLQALSEHGISESEARSISSERVSRLRDELRNLRHASIDSQLLDLAEKALKRLGE